MQQQGHPRQQKDTYTRDRPKPDDTRSLPHTPTLTNLKADIAQTIKPAEEKHRVKSKPRKILIGLIISLSAVMFGYSLKEITSVPIEDIVSVYGITLSSYAAKSILIGILPLGAVFGAIITKFLISRFRRLLGMYIFAIVNCVAIGLVNVTTFPTLLAGRFIEGICVGYYSAIAPIYLREIAVKQLRKMLGIFFSFGKNVGVLIAIAVELILEDINASHIVKIRILLSLTALFAVLQAVLIFFFGSDTPTEMIEKGEHEKAREIIINLIKPEHVEEVFNEYTDEVNAEKDHEVASENLNHKHKHDPHAHPVHKQHKHKHEKEKHHGKKKEIKKSSIADSMESEGGLEFKSDIVEDRDMHHFDHEDIRPSHEAPHQEKKEMTFKEKKSMAFCLVLLLCTIRHFIAGNVIVTQGGTFVTLLDATLGKYTSLIINLVQFGSVIIGLVYIQSLVGKRALFLLSISLLSVLNIAIAIGMIYEQVLSVMMLMCMYMLIYGAAFLSPVWSYPSEIISARESLLPNVVHWVALGVSTLVPPLISGAMPKNNPYPVFIFFGLFGLVSFVIVFRYLRQSNGLIYTQIIHSFK